MPFNAGGSTTRTTKTSGGTTWASDAAASNPINATEFDTEAADIYAMLAKCITKDGNQTVTANIPMNSFKFTGLLDPTSAQDSATKNYADKMLPLAGGAVTGATTFGSTVGITGVATLSSNATVGGTLGVTGNTTLSGNNTLNNPSSGVALTIGGVASSSTTIQAFGPVAGTQQDLTPDTGSFTATITGNTVATTGTITWRRVGKLMTLFALANITGTSNAVTMTMTGIPAVCQTGSGTPFIPCVVADGAGVALAAGQLGAASGTITFYATVGGAGTQTTLSAGGFANSGFKGVDAGWIFQYTLD